MVNPSISGSRTQLFFFFFLASWSFRLPTLDKLVRLFRLEMLSQEFCRRIRRSVQAEGCQTGKKQETQAKTKKRGRVSWKSHKPFEFSGLFKAPWMTAWASSFLALRESMVSLSSINSES